MSLLLLLIKLLLRDELFNPLIHLNFPNLNPFQILATLLPPNLNPRINPLQSLSNHFLHLKIRHRHSTQTSLFLFCF